MHPYSTDKGNTTKSVNDNISSIMSRMVQIAGRLCEDYASDVYYALCNYDKVECESAYRTLSAAKIVDHDEYVSFLWYSIKWYHFDDVVFITNFCHECDDYSLKRIGEEYSDIDEEMGGEDYDMADCCMIVRDFEIGSSKGELTIGKLAREEH